MPAPKPRMHGPDHTHGGPDPVLLAWESAIGDDFGDAAVHVTWTYLGGGTGSTTVIPGTLSDGTTPGFWHTGGTGLGFICGLDGTWQVHIPGTVTHTGTTGRTIIQLAWNGSITETVFDGTLATGGSAPVDFTTSRAMVVDDFVELPVTHVLSSGTPSSTFTGTLVVTKL